MDGTPPATRADQPGPAWYQSYFSAILETNQNRARLKIEQARKAVQDRIIELQMNFSPNHSREIQDLNNALTYLQILLDHIGNDGNALWD
jgi:hypothetical protein